MCQSMKYLIIYTDDMATSYCNFNCSATEPRLIELSALKEGLIWAIKENLRVQIVYPEYDLPKAYEEVIGTVDHVKIKPLSAEGPAEIRIVESCKGIPAIADVDDVNKDIYIVRTTVQEFINNYENLLPLIKNGLRTNVVFTDYSAIEENDLISYRHSLQQLAISMADNWPTGQLNLLTDRMMQNSMNNCNAGADSIALMPDGCFYTCPGFYYDKMGRKDVEGREEYVGNLQSGLHINNVHLYKLEYAPLCRRCDAYNCQRCIYLNKKRTLEVNTPSHIQCVMANLSRNASAFLRQLLKEKGIDVGYDIESIRSLDPIENHPRYRYI